MRRRDPGVASRRGPGVAAAAPPLPPATHLRPFRAHPPLPPAPGFLGPLSSTSLGVICGSTSPTRSYVLTRFSANPRLNPPIPPWLRGLYSLRAYVPPCLRASLAGR